MSYPKLSIITINLNNAEGLKKTIESVVNQTSKDFEYIIIDGGSTDGSIEVIKTYTNIPTNIYISTLNTQSQPQLQPEPEPQPQPQPQPQPPISYWISEPDTGIYNAMNKGIKIAKGEYCQFLNSGDYLVDNNVTEKMQKDLPDCSIVYGNMIKLLKNSKKYIDRNSAGKPLTFLNFYKGTLNHSSAYIKRSLFEKYGYYDETLKIVSDWKFFTIVIGLHNESIKYRDIDMSYFDMSGISNSQNPLEKAERTKVLTEILPINIFNDYAQYAIGILQNNRIKKYKMAKWLFWFIERLLFKWEKYIIKFK